MMRTRLLIAEPDADLRDVYHDLSPHFGLAAETAADGLECWIKLRACPPGALMVDADIPWGGGEGVLARLREDFDGAEPPAVFVTGGDPPGVLSMRFGIIPERCFQKPFRLGAVLDSICSVVAAER